MPADAAAPPNDTANPATVIVVTGVAGSGKSTLAAALAVRLGWPFQEGDELHPAANVAKMAAGQPLTDADRWPWLDAIASLIGEWLKAGRSGVIACSALKRAYRDRLAAAGPGVRFVYMAGDQATVRGRLEARRGHYFPASLLASQFADLEVPDFDEGAVAAPIELPTDTQLELVLRGLSVR
jgi:gluconokinase